MKKNILIVCLLLIINSLDSQINTNSCPCCSFKYKQFDFWLGEWFVYDTLGQLIGENNIRSEQDSCVIIENWKSGNNFTGTSLTYYDRQTDSWYQTYIDNKGNVIKLKGNFKNNTFSLKSENISSSDYKLYNQMTWELDSNKTIIQKWILVNDSNETIRTLFKGIYRRK